MNHTSTTIQVLQIKNTAINIGYAIGGMTISFQDAQTDNELGSKHKDVLEHLMLQ